jgi:acetyl-CoA acetyltransferase
MAAVSVVRIVGAAERGDTCRPEATLTTQRVLAEAARIALGDAALESRDVDGLSVSSFTLRPDRAIDLAVALGLDLGWLMDAGTGGASAIDMLQHAARAVEAGDARTILLVAGDVFHGGDFRALVDEYNVATRDHLAPLPFGGPNSPFALVTRRHMELRGLERAGYGRLVLAQRRWAGLNPGAAADDRRVPRGAGRRRPARPLRLRAGRRGADAVVVSGRGRAGRDGPRGGRSAQCQPQ